MAFCTDDEHWPYMAVLVWIATRNFKRAELDADKSFQHVAGDFPVLAPLAIPLADARKSLLHALERGDLSGLACKHTRAARGLAWWPPIWPAEPFDAFPPRSDLALVSRLEEVTDSVTLRNSFLEIAQPPSRAETLWRNLTFSRADVLRLWGEHPKVLAHQLAKKTPWTPPEGLDKNTLTLLAQDRRVPLEPVVNVLAFASIEAPEAMEEIKVIAARLRAAYGLFNAAGGEAVDLFGTPALPREHLGNPLFAAGPRERISPLEFDNNALALSHLQPSAIGAEKAAANYPEQGACPDAIKWFDVTVDRASLVHWLGKGIGATKRRGTSKKVASCKAWLIELRKNGPQARTKGEYKKDAMRRFSIGPDQFETAWKEAADFCPSDEWGRPGRPQGVKNRPPRKSPDL